MIAWQAASPHPAGSTRRGQARGNHDGLCQAHRQDRDAGGCPRSGCGGDDHPRHLLCGARFGLIGRAFLVEGRRILHERGVPIDWCRRAGCGPSSSASGDSPRKSVLRGAVAPTVKALMSVGAGRSTAVGAADHPDTDGAVAAVGEWNALPPLFDPARDSLLTNLIDRLPSITAVTERQKPAVRGRGSAVADELSAAAAKLSAPARPRLPPLRSCHRRRPPRRW